MRKLAFLGTVLVLGIALFIQACTSREVVGVTAVVVTVSPATGRILEGDSAQLTALVTDAQGRNYSGAPIEWISLDPSIASVDPDGVVHGLVRGTTEVTATYSGVSGRAAVEVLPSAGISVSAASGPTTESGGEATFTMVLDTPPNADVTVALSSSDTGEGVVLTPASGELTFTVADWDVPQTVTVKGQNDPLADGNIAYTIVTAPAVSADPKYDGIDPEDVSFTNNDDDAATISVSAASGPTTERGGTATFTVVLNSLPSSDVSIALSSSNPAEGTVSPSQLTFNTLNWNARQTVTVTGQDDAAPDGNVAYTIVTAPATSTDPTYDGVDPADVAMTNVDDETAGITVSSASRATTEAGGQATFTVTLNAAPSADVTIGLSSSDPTEGTSSASSLTFTTSNWFVAQTVTVTGQDDDMDDGDIVYSIVTAPASSSDANYDGINADDVTVTNVDDETAGIALSPLSGPTTEAGGTASFTVVLTSRPAADVTIALSSGNPAEGMVAPSSLTFTPTTWSIAQTVTVTGEDDAVADGNVVYSVITAPATSTDPLYNGRDALDVAVTNVDDETVGIAVSAVSGPTTEAGGTATFTVVLSTAPSADVTIALSSNNVAEGTVSPAALTFTAAPGPNAWNALHTVTVTGQDDLVDDGDAPYTIVTAPATSTDVNYNGLDAADVTVTNVDDETAGVTVSPISGPTTEAGGTAQFTVVLNSQPTANVTIALSSSDTSEGTVAPASLTFTTSGPTAWNVPQPVTVTGQDDAEADGNVAYTVLTAAATSGDLRYNGIDAADVPTTNVDNETAGITVAPISGPTTEAGGTATFTVSLSSQPSANVTIGLSSSDGTEGTVSPPSLTFTPSGSGAWSVPQTVTVTGVDDFLDDGDVVYTIVTTAATSSDASYSGVDPADVSVTNNDDDTAGFTVSPTGLVTTETGGAGQFTVVLNSQPTASVTLTLTSTDPTEGLASPTSLTFTPTGPTAWNVGQTVTVTGQDDLTADGNVVYAVVTNPATSSDPRYDLLNPADVSVTNIDNETAGITVSPISGPTTEGGNTATFTVVLSTQPSSNVSIALSSNNTGEGTVSPPLLTFTASGTSAWNVPQTVTVTGVDDAIDDGNVVYAIVTAAATSGDATYNGLDAADVSVTNNDDDTAGVTISPTGLVTTEAGGSGQFTVVLNSQPTANVTVTLASNDLSEGVATPSSLTFTPTGSTAWNVAQTVTVTGQDDPVADGNVPYLIVTDPVTSTDPRYNGVNPADVSVSNVDDETAGITVSPISGPTTEGGGTAAFTIVLSTQPTADVTIALSSSNTDEGTVAPASITFTPSGSNPWNVPQVVTVTGIDDFVDDGDVAFSILTSSATSSDGNYDDLDPVDVAVTNNDDDTAGVTLSPTGLVTTEAGGTAQFTVMLNSQPTADVTLTLASSDPTEGLASPTSLTFTPTGPSAWNVAQPVTVTGQDDLTADGNVAYAIATNPVTSSDGKYDGLNPADVSVVNVDNETAGITVSPISGPTTEAGGTATFTVVLSTPPSASVTLGLSSTNTSEGTVAPASLTFTPSGPDPWNVPQVVTVTGIDDDVDDGNVAFTIVTTSATSADPAYDEINPADVAVTNNDDDTAGFTVSPSGVVTTEGGGAAQFTVVLDSRPTADVTITLASNDPTEGSASPTSLTFTPAGPNPWNVAQSVTVTGQDDATADGNAEYAVVLDPATSLDPLYDGLNPADVSATNVDNETAGITVSPISGPTTEAGGTATFTVVLSTQPAANVTITLSSSNTSEGTAAPASLTFTPSGPNPWNVPQVVTVTGVDDDVDDGNATFTIVTNPATSADPVYDQVNPADVSVTNVDDETAAIAVSPISGPTTETGGAATFTVVLTSRPTASVAIGVSSNDTGEGSVTSPLGGTLTFTDGSWDTPQTVTVTGQDDDVDDDNVMFLIVTAPATSADPAYNGMNAPDVSVTNVDDDVAGVSVSPVSGPTSEAGGTTTFTVVLNSQPTADVVVSLTSADPSEGVASPPSLTFAPSGPDAWDVEQTVTVTGQDDAIDDDNVAYSITTAASSTDPKYNGINVADVPVTNLDDADTAGVVVTPTSGLVTTESGGTAQFTVVLTSEPVANVTIGLVSSDPGEGAPTSGSITFTPSGAGAWNVPRPVTVAGVDDDVDDDDQSYTIVTTASSSDAKYGGIAVADVSLTNTDDDTAGFTVSPTSGLVTTESGGAASFTVRLNSEPTADVTIGLSSSDTTEGTVGPTSLTFTAGDWSAPQTVTVTGADDASPLVDGSVAYTVVTGAATSSDAKYTGLNPANVSVTNADNETPDIDLEGIQNLSVDESGTTVQFRVALMAQPVDDVVLSITSNDTGEVTVVGTPTITFTTLNWSNTVFVTLRGEDDAVIDGPQIATITVSVVDGSSDPLWSGVADRTFVVTNTDND